MREEVFKATVMPVLRIQKNTRWYNVVILLTFLTQSLYAWTGT